MVAMFPGVCSSILLSELLTAMGSHNGLGCLLLSWSNANDR